MKPYEIAVENLVPHGGNMVLLEQLLRADDDSATAKVIAKNAGLFFADNGQVPAWVGIEYMAQTIAAWAGFHALLADEPVKLGFLLGTRKYHCNVSHFSAGQVLQVEVERIMQGDNGLASFACHIRGEGIEADAMLNVFQSDELSKQAESKQQEQTL